MTWRALAVSAASAFTLTVILATAHGRAAEPALTDAQSAYLEHCAGCHGLQGSTDPAPIPVLRGRAGWFMCTPAGRDYLIRLPNVAHARLGDAELAEMMNFVAFDLGRTARTRNARPFDAAETGRLRAQALVGTEVMTMRKAVVEAAISRCGAPAALRLAYPGQTRP